MLEAFQWGVIRQFAQSAYRNAIQNINQGCVVQIDGITID